jgi:hypothetical protein
VILLGIRKLVMYPLRRIDRWGRKQKQRDQAQGVLAMGMTFTAVVSRPDCPESYKPGLLFAARMAAMMADKLNKGEVY